MKPHTIADPVTLDRVRIKDSFWDERIRLIREIAVPYQWEIINDRVPGAEPSHAVENFRIAAGLSTGGFYGRVFQDSDVAKWLEAVAYCLADEGDSELEAKADSVIDIIEKAQQPDGYLNTYYTIKEPGKRWTNIRDKHEMYCAGHMMEAAVAYYYATGKRKLLDIMCRFADHIDAEFGPEEGKRKAYPGHQEIELALVKLYKATGNEKYLRLSSYFINERGKEPFYYDLEATERGEEGNKGHYGDYSDLYRQSHLPVREQKEAVGHAVRAVYMYSGMADIAVETGDQSLTEACKVLWDNVTGKQIYITGGLGSQDHGEDFSFNFDLPNDTAYTETCAAIGLIFWAQRMQRMEMDGRYGDIMEKALYNGVLSGMSLDGRKYFYVNPLEVWPEACHRRHDQRHVETVRQEWFGCACCPPNLARLIASLGGYVYSTDSDTVYTHLYMGSTADVTLNGQQVKISQTTGYPWGGKVKLSFNMEHAAKFTLALRIPGWCPKYTIKVNGVDAGGQYKLEKGYLKLDREWNNDNHVEVEFQMDVIRMEADPRVRENAGKAAIQRGPVIYCLEEADNGAVLSDISLARNPEFTTEFKEDLLGGVVVIKGKALRSLPASQTGFLYKELDFQRVPVVITAIPYYAWNNRGEGEMRVWINQAMQ